MLFSGSFATEASVKDCLLSRDHKLCGNFSRTEKIE